MAISKQYKIGMDLIADEKDVVLCADAAYTLHFFFCPTPPNRVMRAAEDHKFRLRTRSALLQVLKVDRVTAIFIKQSVVGKRAFLILNSMDKGMIYRLQYK